MQRSRIRVVILPFLLVGLACSPPLESSDIAAESLSVKVGSISPNWVIEVGLARGFFEQEGLYVELEVTSSSERQIEGLTSGLFDIGHQASSHVIRAVEGGNDLFFFMGAGPRPILSLIVDSEVASYADLEGKTLVVDSLHTGYTHLLRRMLADNGVAEEAYSLEAVGNSANRFEALMEGKANGSLLSQPLDIYAQQQGLRLLDTTRDYLPPDYQSSAVAARRDWAEQHKEEVVRYIRGFVAACQWLINPAHKEEVVDVLLSDQDWYREIALKAYDVQRERLICSPEVSLPGLTVVLEEMVRFGQLDESVSGADKYIDPSFWEAAAR